MSSGQSFTLNGTLKDSLTGEKLSYATIFNQTNKKGCKTDEKGIFELEVLLGFNQIKIHHIGCEPKFLNLKVVKNINDTTIFMAHHTHELDDIVITDYGVKPNKSNKDKLSENEIITLSHKNISSIIEKMPGVSTLNTGYSISKPSINGMYGSRVITFNNDIKQEGQQWGAEHGLEIDANNANEIVIVKGVQSLRYSGDAIGGILLIKPSGFFEKDTFLNSVLLSGTDNGRQGNISFSTQKVVKNKYGISRGVIAKYSAKRSGDLKSPEYYLKNTGFAEQNFNIMLRLLKSKKHNIEIAGGYYFNKIAILKISHFGNLDDLQKAIDNSFQIEKGEFSYTINRPYQLVSHLTGKVKWEFKISEKSKIEVIYALQKNNRKEFDSHNYVNKKSASMELDLITHQNDIVFEQKLSKKVWLQSGISTLVQTNNYKGRYFIPNYLKTEINQFSILKLSKNRNQAEIGYRAGFLKNSVFKWENYQIENYHISYSGISVQAGWNYKINHDLSLNIFGGNMWRSPNINELFSNGLHHGTASIEYGDLNLKKEVSVAGTILLKLLHNKTIAEGEIYLKSVNNFIYLKPKFPPELTIRGAFPAFKYSQTDVLISGAEIFIKQKVFKKIEIKEKAQMLNFDDLKSDTFINFIPPYSFSHYITYTFGKNKIFENSEIELNFKQVLKQNKYTENTDYTAPPDGYSLVNFSFKGNVSQKVFVFGSVENLFNKKFRNYMNRLRYFANEPGRMINLGISIKI